MRGCYTAGGFEGACGELCGLLVGAVEVGLYEAVPEVLRADEAVDVVCGDDCWCACGDEVSGRRDDVAPGVGQENHIGGGDGGCGVAVDNQTVRVLFDEDAVCRAGEEGDVVSDGRCGAEIGGQNKTEEQEYGGKAVHGRFPIS